MKTTGPPNDPLSNFALSVFTMYGLLMRSGENATRPFGQTSARWQVLGRAGYQPQTVAHMAHEMGTSRQGVQYVANRLLQEGLITMRDNPRDKRAKLVELTPHGKQVLMAIYAQDQVWSQHIMAQLNPQQLEQVSTALTDIAHVFEAHLSQNNNQE